MTADDMTAAPQPSGPEIPAGDGMCWVITDDRVGTINQAMGLAEAVGFPFVHVFQIASPSPYTRPQGGA